MLANPHWDAPSFSSFETWLEGKDPQEKYTYSDCNNCACAQYLKHVGKFDEKWLGKAKFDDPISRMNSVAAGNLGDDEPSRGHTFGELLTRVRKIRSFAVA